MWEFLKNLLAPVQFIPHGHCYLWKPSLVSLHVISDSLIVLAYYSIPMMLAYFAYQRRDMPMPFRWMFFLFGAFIISCGTTHLMDIWTLWHPAYWISGSLKAITAFISCYTAVELVTLIPKALALPSPAQLETTNQRLEREITERRLAEAASQESDALFRSIFEGADIGMTLTDKSGKPVLANPAFSRMLGYSDEELQQKCFTEFTHADDIATNWELFQELVAGKRDHYQIEKRYLHKNGQIIWGNLIVSSVQNPEGKYPLTVAMVEDITERKQAEEVLCRYKEHLEELVAERTVALTKVNEQLSWQASHDALTGLINRHEFEKYFETAILSARTQQQEHALCYIDLDRFKLVNDTCGHVAGDELLCQVSALLKRQCRKTDILARLGGDEFALLLYRCSLEEAQQVAQSLRESIQAFRFVWRDKTFSIGVSIGLVAIHPNSHSADILLSAADAACYTAKNRGRNRVHVYQENDGELAQQLNEMHWIGRLNQAIVENQFRLYCQPIVSLERYANGSIPAGTAEHYEVLLRLCDENGNLIPPMAFIPAAERYNLMPAIDRWVIRTFFEYLQHQRRDSWQHCLYAINLSGASVNDDQFIDFIKEQFQIYPLPPGVICFEITETFAIANLKKAVDLIHEIKALGCRFSLDDFGSGMSSFGYLKHLPVDYLKIDGCFIKEVADDPMTCAMVEAINRIGHVIGLKTIAEFVTNEAILEKIKLLGIDYAQGYGIAIPQPLLSPESLQLCKLDSGFL